MLQYSDNREAFEAALIRAGYSLQDAGVIAINKAADVTAVRYKSALSSGRIKLRAPTYTKGAVRILKAHAMHSDKKRMRKMENINAIVGVMARANGQEHYLATMEVGGEKKGSRKTGGKVAVPLLAARGGNDMKPIAPAYRVTTHTPVQLQDAARRAQNVRQQYAMMYAMAKRGLAVGLYQTDDAIFSVSKRKVRMVRKTDRKTIRVKAIPLFGESVGQINQDAMDRYFKYGAKKLLDKLETK